MSPQVAADIRALVDEFSPSSFTSAVRPVPAVMCGCLRATVVEHVKWWGAPDGQWLCGPCADHVIRWYGATVVGRP